MAKEIHTNIVLDMDSTLLSMECLDTVIETALAAQLHPDAIADAMMAVNAEMDKGMAGSATLQETIPARIDIAKQLGAPVQKEHFEIVARIVPSTLTPSIVNSIKDECSVSSEYPVQITIVSGGPQICVNAAVSELERQVSALDGAAVSFKGYGNDIRVTPEGDFDQLSSKIHNSKVQRVAQVVKEARHTIMIGDGATDVEVYDEGIANYFIAVGFWVEREVLFNRQNNLPYYRKVNRHEDMSKALHDAIHASQTN